MKHMKLGVVTIAMIVLLGAGCNKKTIVSTPEVTVTQEDGDTLKVSNNSGDSAVFTTDKLANNFPSDVPIFPGATVAGSQLTNYGATASLQIKKSSNEVAAWYKNELVNKSWSITSNYTMEKSTWIGGSKDDGSTILVTVNANDNPSDPNQTLVGILRSANGQPTGNVQIETVPVQ